MQLINYFFVLLVASYLFHDTCKGYSIFLSSRSGNHLLYYISRDAIIIGLLELIIYILIFWLKLKIEKQLFSYEIFINHLFPMNTQTNEREIYYFPFIVMAGASLLFSLLIGKFLNFIDEKFFSSKGLLNAYKKVVINNEFEKLILYGFDERINFSFTLENEKVYIGRLLENVLCLKKEYIKILPIKSGYRDNKDKTLKITTDYVKIYKDIMEKHSSHMEEAALCYENFSLVIPYSRIVSVNFFDPNIYIMFENNS